jgi:hypothetical protein
MPCPNVQLVGQLVGVEGVVAVMDPFFVDLDEAIPGGIVTEGHPHRT